MKVFLALASLTLALSFAACTESSTTTSHTNPLTGTTTNENTTVRQYPNGTTTVDQSKTKTP